MLFQQALLNTWKEGIVTNPGMYEVTLAVLFRDLQKLKILVAFRKMYIS